MKIDELSDIVLQKIKEEGHSEKTFVHYVGSAYNPLVKEYKSKFGDEVQKENLLALRQEYASLFQESKVGRDSFRRKVRAINNMLMLLDGVEYERRIFPSVLTEVEVVCEKYMPTYEAFLDSISGLKNPSCCTIVARRFFVFLEKKCGSPEIRDLTFDHCRLFMSDGSRGFKNSSDSVAYALRKLFQFLNDTGRNKDMSWKLVKATAPRSRKVLPPFPQEDIVSIIQSLDEEAVADKRDAAVVTLMSVSALRCCDIGALRLTDINWRENTVTVLQDKTDNYVTIPVEHKFLEPTADYILNWRPKCSSEYVFLSVTQPYRRLQGEGIGALVRRAIKNAGIEHMRGDGKTPHGIRRSLPTEMVAQGAPLHLAGQVIGQVNIESARSYVALDVEGLRRCAIPLSSIRRCQG